MSRILIVYSTRAGTTAHVANLLAREFRRLGHQVTVASASAQPSPEGADFYIVGSGILASNWNPEALEWLSTHADQLRGRLALFNVCLTAADPGKREDALAYNDAAAAIVEPVASETFAGRFRPERVKWWERLMLRLMGQGVQDHIDPAAIARWADDLAGARLAE